MAEAACDAPMLRQADGQEEASGGLMGKVNRIVILARPTRSYFEWAKFADDSEASYSMLDLRRDCSAWLLPVGENLEKFLRKHFDEIFRRELFAITKDEKEFPANRTYVMFRDWFDVEIHSAVYDLDDKPLKNR